MPAPGTTAVLALLPDAEPLLELATQIDARAVRPGIPAHATLLYPWLPTDQIGDRELEQLQTALVRATPQDGRIPLRLTAVEQTGAFINVPVPDLHAIATAVRIAFPQQTPYAGRFGHNPPVHVTVSLDATADTATATDITHRVTSCLPIHTEVSAIHVVTLTPNGWQNLAELPLTT